MLGGKLKAVTAHSFACPRVNTIYMQIFVFCRQRVQTIRLYQREKVLINAWLPAWCKPSLRICPVKQFESRIHIRGQIFQKFRLTFILYSSEGFTGQSVWKLLSGVKVVIGWVCHRIHTLPRVKIKFCRCSLLRAQYCQWMYIEEQSKFLKHDYHHVTIPFVYNFEIKGTALFKSD